MAAGTITIEVKRGPVLRMALDVLDMADDLWREVPDWIPEKDEFRARCESMRDECLRMIREQK
jgi:hypothetical protein